MIMFNRFKGGLSNILTLSYDDGVPEDKRLIEILNRYGIKATFNLNSGKFKDYTKEQKEELIDLYKGHEIAVHTVHHPFLEKMPLAGIFNEVMEDRKALEDICGYIVRGMAYPYGTYNGDVLHVLKDCGICFSRTTKSTRNFNLPEDFLQWHPTCHHKDCLEVAKDFLKNMECPWRSGVFYVWGHSYEFRDNNNWDLIEEFCKMTSSNDKIWYATNIEIYDYVQAQKGLLISADERIIKNPSAIDVWISKDNETLMIKAGETLHL